VDYSLLIMVASGMMKMASGEDFPLRQGTGKGSRWYFEDTEACGGGVQVLG
jgi:hypothetical protein